MESFIMDDDMQRYLKYWEIYHSMKMLKYNIYKNRILRISIQEEYQFTMHEIYNILIRPTSVHPMSNYRIHPWVII